MKTKRLVANWSVRLTLLLLCGAGVQAQEQAGAIEGTVHEPDGAPVAGATIAVRSAGPRLETTTDSMGRFAIVHIPPGDYLLEVEAVGFAAPPTPIAVTVGKTRRLAIVASHARAVGDVSVAAPAADLDFAGGSHTREIRRSEIDGLPHGSDITELAAQLPGVSLSSDVGGLSIDGSSGSENRFFLDGLDVTHPLSGVNAKPLAPSFVDTLQVKFAGYQAEFGGSTGGVVSVLTQRGSDQFAGSLGLWASDTDANGDSRPVLTVTPDRSGAFYLQRPPDEQRSVEPRASWSGPLWPGRFWFFAGYEQLATTTERQVDFGAGRPQDFSRETTGNATTLNLSGQARASVLWRVTVNDTPQETRGTLPEHGSSGSSDLRTYGFGTDTDNLALAATADWMAGRRLSVSVRTGRLKLDQRTTGAELTPFVTHFSGLQDVFPEIPADLVRPPGFVSAPRYDVTYRDRFERTTHGGDLQSGWKIGDDGEVIFKLGAQYEALENDLLRAGSSTVHRFGWDRRDEFFGERGRYGNLVVENPGASGEVRSEQLALFAQASWRPRPSLTIDAGLRAEDETIPDFRLGHQGEAAIHFGLEDKLAPRLGFTWVLGREQAWRMYGSWGTYFDQTKYQLARTSFGAERRVLYTYRLDDFDWTRVRCTIAHDPAAPPDCGLPLIGAVNLREPSNEAIDPAIRPTESREWQLVLERRLRRLQLAARYVHKEVVRIIEDIGSFDAGRAAEVFVIGNPGEGASQWAQPGLRMPRPVRDFDAVELSARHDADNWMVDASYTYSRLYGNYPGLASSDEAGRTAPNIQRIYDSWFNVFDQRARPVHGRLATDRPHQVEIRAAYTAPRGWSVGFHQYFGSGTPRTTEALRQGVFFFPYGRGDLGRNPTLTQTDLRLGFGRRVAKVRLDAALVVANLFDEDAVTAVAEHPYRDQVQLTDEEFRRGFDIHEVAARQGMRANPDYGMPVRFQAPRSVRVGIGLRW